MEAVKREAEAIKFVAESLGDDRKFDWQTCNKTKCVRFKICK